MRINNLANLNRLELTSLFIRLFELLYIYICLYISYFNTSLDFHFICIWIHFISLTLMNLRFIVQYNEVVRIIIVIDMH